MAKKYYDHKSKADYEEKYEKKARPGAPGPIYSMEHSGMPTKEVMESYPNASYSCDGEYVDTSMGIDMFASQNYKKVMKQKRGLGDA